MTNAIQLLTAAKLVANNITKVDKIDESLADLHGAIADKKVEISAALDNDGDFVGLSKEYKALNNKLDKLITQREDLVLTLFADIDAVREVLARVSSDVRALEG